MVWYTLRSSATLKGFAQGKNYKLSTIFKEENGSESRYLVLTDDKKTQREFTPKIFYSYFKHVEVKE